MIYGCIVENISFYGDFYFEALRSAYLEYSYRLLFKRKTDLALLYAKINEALGISLLFLSSNSMFMRINSGIFSGFLFGFGRSTFDPPWLLETSTLLNYYCS